MDDLPLVQANEECPESLLSRLNAETKLVQRKWKDLKSYLHLLARLSKQLQKDEDEQLLPLFYTLKNLGRIDSGIISPEVQKIVTQAKEKIDSRIIEFQSEFTRSFIKAVAENKAKVLVEAKQVRFPKFVLNDRLNVEFKFSESLARLDDSVTVSSIDAQKVAAEAIAYYRDLWITNPDLKHPGETINRYFEAYRKAVFASGKTLGDDIPIHEFHKFVTIENQGETFWRDPRRDQFKPVSTGMFKPVLSAFLANPVSTRSGYRMKFAPVRDTEKNALHVFSPHEKSHVFLGLVKFVKEAL